MNISSFIRKDIILYTITNQNDCQIKDSVVYYNITNHNERIFMKSHAFLVILVSLLFVFGCSNNDSGTGPDDNETNQLLVSGEIGPEGGTIETDDIAITVPSMAFDSTVSLSLYKSSVTTDIGSDACSELYFIEGLPAYFDDSLTIRIALTQPLQETGNICISNAPFIQELGNHNAAPFLIEAVDSSGFLVGKWSQPSELLQKSVRPTYTLADNSFRKYFQAWKNWRRKKRVSHFEYHLPASLTSSEQSMMENLLEEAFDSITIRGLDTSHIFWPMPVYAWKFKPNIEDRYCLFLRPEVGRYVLVFDETNLLDVNYPPSAPMRELYHAVSASGDPSYFLSGNIADPARFWFHHAFASWAEGWKGYAEDEHPLDYDNANESILAPLKGMVAGKGTTIRQSMMHGGGMSAMAKYVVDNYQETILNSIASGIANGDDPVKALIDAIAPYNTVNVWYADFLKEYTRGALYPFSVASLYDSELWSIENSNDTTHTFTLTIPDLGAKVCEIQLNEASINEITFTLSSSQVATEDMLIIVHGDISGQSDTYLTSAGGQVVIHDIKSLRLQGVTTLYAVVVNSSAHAPEYSTNGTINLKVDVNMKETPQYNQCLVWFNIQEYYTSVYQGNPSDTEYLVREFWPNWEPVRGSFIDDTTWTAKLDTVDSYNLKYTCTLQVVFHDDFLSVSRFQVKATKHPDPSSTQTISIRGVNLPLVLSSTSYDIFRADGTDACARISDITDKRDWGTTVEELYFYTCEPTDFISIRMSVEP